MVIEEDSFGMAFCSENILADSIAFFYTLKFYILLFRQGKKVGDF